MATMISKTEFDLTVRKYGEKNEDRDIPYRLAYPDRGEKESELEVKEELRFKSLSAVEVIRKLLDYIQDTR